MRPIKFRAWHEGKKEMWSPELLAEYQYTLMADGNGFINVSGISTKLSELLPLLIPMQFTGLKDKNGTEIYHHDILQIRSPDLTTEHFLGEVIWDYMAWQIRDGGMLDSFKNLHLEVIGNIHQNPELLEQS